MRKFLRKPNAKDFLSAQPAFVWLVRKSNASKRPSDSERVGWSLLVLGDPELLPEA